MVFNGIIEPINSGLNVIEKKEIYIINLSQIEGVRYYARGL